MMRSKIIPSLKAAFLEPDDPKSFDQHILAGVTFNQIVSNLNLSSYFAKGMRKGLLDNALTAGEWATAPMHSVDLDGYIVPGDLPTSDTGRVLYWLVYRWLESQDEEVELLRRAIHQYETDTNLTELITSQVSGEA